MDRSEEMKKDENRRILFVINTLTNGGAERTISTLSMNFRKPIRCDVLVNSVSDEDYPFYGQIISLGMQSMINKGLFYHIRAAIKRIIVLRRLKKNGEYEAVISFMESANFINILTGNKNCRVIISVRNILSVCYARKSHFLLPISRLLYRFADEVVALSEGCRDDLIKNFNILPEKCTTIYNGYDVGGFDKKEKEVPTIYNSEKKFHIITMGRNVQQKGQWHLIRAFQKVHYFCPNTDVVILGQGDLQDYFKELIMAYGLDDCVTIQGFVENPQSYLRNADCFVFPSLFEGFGNAVIEALIAGLPIIATDYDSGAREILAPSFQGKVDGIYEGEYGILIPVCSGKRHKAEDPLEPAEEIMADAIIRCVRGEVGGQYTKEVLFDCISRFSIEKAISGWTRILDNNQRHGG